MSADGKWEQERFSKYQNSELVQKSTNGDRILVIPRDAMLARYML